MGVGHFHASYTCAPKTAKGRAQSDHDCSNNPAGLKTVCSHVKNIRMMGVGYFHASYTYA